MSQHASTIVDPARWEGRLFNGAWIASPSGTLLIQEPANGRPLHAVGLAGAEDISAAVASASKAQRDWAAASPRERAAVLLRAAQILEVERDEIAALIARETGGIHAKGEMEITESVARLHKAAAIALEPQGEVLPSPSGRLSLARRVPIGVVGVISPFNFPLVLGFRSVAPALALGNAVILKPDPRTPFSGGVVIAAALEQAGLPKGVLHMLPGGSDVGQALVEDPGVPMISFTGSTAAGRRIGELAGSRLKKVSLELGGKNALIVLDDTDLDRAASAVAFGSWFHQGQICMATGRVLAQRTIVAELTRRLVEKAAASHNALGPIIDRRQLEHVVAVVRDSVAQGAVVEAGGSHEGLFYRPTVLSGVGPGVRAYREEVFGPVVSIIPFDTDEEATVLANDTEYGLATGILSGSVGRALTLSERLRTGVLHINDQTVSDEVVNPFGGIGASGNGSSVGGSADLDLYTHWQWVTVRSQIPPYPF
ncbi:benzaldehyde dehydrogenase [Brenneria populi subsp. brevivirga]|uniref:benzaldehyde dehydrogenase n=1 Tax=Brenneria populi TaxID=1505588 RepID=UPI002E16CB77|nr:benzaldehyde dehydrogenase [Brenneria populi subsp. brevivirga]